MSGHCTHERSCATRQPCMKVLDAVVAALPLAVLGVQVGVAQSRSESSKGNDRRKRISFRASEEQVT